MDTVESIAGYLKLQKTPYWWVHSGTAKVGQFENSDNVEDSIAHFLETAKYWPNGNYRIECTDKVNNRTTSFKLPFVKGSGTGSGLSSNSMQAGISTNAYGISDAVLAQIQSETRRTLLFEQMADKFGPMVDLVKDLEKRVQKLEKQLEDEDGDGTPDILEMTKKASEVVKAGSEIKRVFTGGKMFG